LRIKQSETTKHPKDTKRRIDFLPPTFRVFRVFRGFHVRLKP
jgi:hypothetical protein